MKHYKREYEHVFKKNVKKKCKIDKISIYKKNPESMDKYIRLYQETFETFYENMFNDLLKLTWLERRFCYNRKRVIKRGRNGFSIDQAKSLFVRNYVGYDPKFIFMSTSPLTCISKYIDDFFPNFNEESPFEKEFKYPFKYMHLEALVLVSQMDERMDLLKYGEKHKMGLEDFKDYVINYINCYNDEHGEKYLFKFSNYFMPYIALSKIYNKTQKNEEIKARNLRSRGKKF